MSDGHFSLPRMGPLPLDEIGNRYGKLVVLRYSGTDRSIGNSGGATWVCRCDCGGTKIVRGGQLRSGRVKTCGNCLGQQKKPGVKGLLERIKWVGKSPCERGCSKFDFCRDHEMACGQFAKWVQRGGQVFPDLQEFPPNRVEYIRLFEDDEQQD